MDTKLTRVHQTHVETYIGFTLINYFMMLVQNSINFSKHWMGLY